MVYLSINLPAAGDGCRLFYLADDSGPCILGYGPCRPYDTVRTKYCIDPSCFSVLHTKYSVCGIIAWGKKIHLYISEILGHGEFYPRNLATLGHFSLS